MHDILVWIITALTIVCVLSRPFGWPEWIFAAVGAGVLTTVGLEPVGKAAEAFRSGFDVYFFLIGMMLLSEVSREEGVFDWLASLTAEKSQGSSFKLFLFIYGIGTLVTVFMSNDATAVVLTPAVYACVKRAKVDPKPHLFACAMIANAASFFLPISNPANLVVYGKNLPDLLTWIKSYGLASIVSVVTTFVVLAFVFRRELKRGGESPYRSDKQDLTRTGKITLASLALVIIALLISSATHTDLGLPTLGCALLVVIGISVLERSWPKKVFKNVSWGVIPLVGGLFIVVDALNRAQVLGRTKELFESADHLSPVMGREAVAFGVGFISNIANNLPVGLTVGLAAQASKISEMIRQSLLIGVDLGPNLSVTGSLATILWLMALRREGEKVGFWEFLEVGAIAMPLSLFLSILAL